MEQGGWIVTLGQTERIVSPTKDFLNWHPAFLQWGILVAMLSAFACAILLPAVLLNLKIIQDFSILKNPERGAMYLVSAIVLGGGFLWVSSPVSKALLIPDELFERQNLLYYKHVDLHFWFTRVIVLAGLLCFLGLLLLNLVISDRNARNGHDAEIESALQAELECYFRFFSTSVSILITGGILTSLLQRDVLYSVVKPASEAVTHSAEWKALSPMELVFIFGFNQVVFLMAFLVPTFHFIHRSGQLALNRIQFYHPEAGAVSPLNLSPRRKLLQNLWLWGLILSPFMAFFASKLLRLLEASQ